MQHVIITVHGENCQHCRDEGIFAGGPPYMVFDHGGNIDSFAMPTEGETLILEDQDGKKWVLALL